MKNLVADLSARGFVSVGNGKFEFAEGSISRYTKCTINLSYCLWGDLANEYFYSVRFESFAESGQPEIDHHTNTECYMTKTQIIKFLSDKGILTKAERAERWANLKKRVRG